MVRGGKVLLPENSRTILHVSAKLETEPEKGRQYLAAVLATLIALSAGMCLSWSSSAIPMLMKEGAVPQVTRSEGAWIGSLITLGACVGAIPAGLIANKIGRKLFLQILSIPIFVSWLMIAFSSCVYGLYAARVLAGLAVGAVSVAAPMYVAELAHVSIRGTLGTFFQVQITIGLFLEYVLGGTVGDFKFLALASSILPVVFVGGFSFMPETPVHLYAKGRPDQARNSLIYFRGHNYHSDDELMKIAEDIKEANTNRAKLSDLIDGRAAVKGLVISLGLMVFQQLSGINNVLFYAGDIFAETGSHMSPHVCAILLGAVQVVATLVSTILIDRAGRKILLFVSSLVMCICLITLGTYLHLKQYQDLTYLSALPIICLGVFIILFSIGFGPIPWMIMGEIFTPKTKGIASSISAAFNWILAFTVTNQFQNMVATVGIGFTFVIFGAICGLGAIFVLVMVPETKGKDVDEVQDMLMGRKCNSCPRQCQKTTVV